MSESNHDNIQFAYLYVRVSTTKQGDSVIAQEQRLRNYCEANNYEIKDLVVDDGISGKSTKNRSIDNLITQMIHGSVLVVDALSRLSRNMADSHRLVKDLESNGCHLHTLKEGLRYTPNESMAQTGGSNRLTLGLFSLLSEMEVNQLSQRVSQGLQARKNAGFITQKTPYGWRKTNDKRFFVKLPDHSDQQQCIKFIMNAKDNGISFRKIAEQLTKEKFPRPYKPYDAEGNLNPWSYSSSRNIYMQESSKKYYQFMPGRGYIEPPPVEEKKPKTSE